MKKFKTDREFLQEIEAWLCFNSNPPHDQILELKHNLQNHLSIPLELPVKPEIAEIDEIRSNPNTKFLLSCMRVNAEVPDDEVWVSYGNGNIQKFRIL